MVKGCFLFLLVCSILLHAEVSVETRVIQNAEGLVYGVLQVSGTNLEPTALLIESTPIAFEKGKDGLFRFKPPEISVGLHLLPPVTVFIDEKKYITAPVSYKVVQVLPKQNLHLEAEIRGERPFYPGQRIDLVYRIYYKGAVDLLVQKFPFFEENPFLKVGSLEVKEFTWNGFGVQEIAQKIELKEPIEHTFKGGFLEGIANNKKIQSKSAEMVVEVIPFPEEGKPPSFNGVLGEYIMKVALLGGSTVRVGDPFKLELQVLGKGAFHTLKPQRLQCVPGFSGFFTVDEIAEVERINGGKRFIFTIHPNVSLYPYVPSIEFSSFSRNFGYQIVRSDPIPLSFQKKSEQIPTLMSVEEPIKGGVNWEHILRKEVLKKRKVSTVVSSSLHLAWLGTWWGAFLNLIACFFLYTALDWGKRKMNEKKKEKTPIYLIYYSRAKKKEKNREQCLKWAEKTLVALQGEELLLERVRANRYGRESSYSTKKILIELKNAIGRKRGG